MPAGRPPNYERRDAIVQDIIDHPGSQRGMISIRLNVPYRMIRYYTDILVRDGVLECDKTNRIRKYVYVPG